MPVFTSIPYRQYQLERQLGGRFNLGFLKSVLRSGPLRNQIVQNIAGPRGRSLLAKLKKTAKGKIGKRGTKKRPRKTAANNSSTALVPLGDRSVVPWTGAKNIPGASGRSGAKNPFLSTAHAFIGDPTMKRYARNYMLMKGAKAVGKQALKGATETGMDYLGYRLAGGEALTSAEAKQITNKTGVDLMKKTMDGQKVTPKVVRSTVRKNVAEVTKNKPRRTVGQTRRTLAQRVVDLQTKLNADQKATRQRLTKGIKHNLIFAQKFGTGAKKRGRKGSKKKKKSPKRKKRSPKRKKKSSTKSRRRKAGLKKMNVTAAKARYDRLRDVFEIG